MTRPPLGVAPAPIPPGFPGRVAFVKSAARLAQAPHSTLPEVCFCGRSNVGKSTLLNTLCNRKQLARVSSTPGRTQLLNFFNVQDTVTFVDLPGYGWAKTPKDLQSDWGTSIRDYLRDRPQLALSLLLVDLRRDPGDDERNLLTWFQATGRPCLIVATKSDKVGANQVKSRVAVIARALEVPVTDVIAFASTSREGRDAVWGAILAFAAPPAPEAPAP